MGQYYKAVVLANQAKLSLKDRLEMEVRGNDTKILGYFTSWDYQAGSKLMEHSWLKNKYVNTVASMFAPDGQFYKDSLVWAGDYADEEPDGITLYGMCDEEDYPEVEHLKPKVSHKRYRYVINHVKKLYVDTRRVPISDTYTAENGKKYHYRIHPLPLLTCSSNGLGGGDFYGNDSNNLVGSWARDIISVDNIIPAGYERLEFNLVE